MSYRSPYKVTDGHKYAPSIPTLFYKLTVKILDTSYKGVFAEEFIPSGATVGIDGGTVVTSIDDVFPEKKYAVLIGEDLWLAPNDYDNMEALFYLNHSCDPNLARMGSLVYVTKKNIQPGEELLIDYAPFVTGFRNWTLECECKSSNCRKIITSKDWQNPELAKILWKEWLPFIQKKIISGSK